MAINFTENKDSIYWHLIDFYNSIELERKENPATSIGDIAKSYIDNEIAMEKGMAEYREFLRKINKYNERLLKAIKSVKGRSFYKHLIDFLKESEPTEYSKFEILKEPTGKKQEENYGRSIRYSWVNQRSVGDSGDSFEGEICIMLKPGKYLRWHYSC